MTVLNFEQAFAQKTQITGNYDSQRSLESYLGATNGNQKDYGVRKNQSRKLTIFGGK
tara:strand:- start:924 stop:1094 length:171 start_codon:yes stop_codon:yes gene_type:complete